MTQNFLVTLKRNLALFYAVARCDIKIHCGFWKNICLLQRTWSCAGLLWCWAQVCFRSVEITDVCVDSTIWTFSSNVVLASTTEAICLTSFVCVSSATVGQLLFQSAEIWPISLHSKIWHKISLWSDRENITAIFVTCLIFHLKSTTIFHRNFGTHYKRPLL